MEVFFIILKPKMQEILNLSNLCHFSSITINLKNLIEIRFDI